MDTTAWIKINVFSFFFKEKNRSFRVASNGTGAKVGNRTGTGPSLECSVLVKLQSEFYTENASWCSVEPSVIFKLILPPCFLMGSFRWRNSMNSLPQPPQGCCLWLVRTRILVSGYFQYRFSPMWIRRCTLNVHLRLKFFFFFLSLEFLRRLQSQT